MVFISVGELSSRKNHRVVIESLTGMKGNFQYYIVGQGPLKEELNKLIEEKGMSNCVHLLGFRTDVADLLNAADVYVFPSRQEGLPVALMEAMASGLPSVVSRIRGNTDLINDEDCLFEPSNVNECEEVLQRMLTADLKQIGEKNQMKIKAYSCEQVSLLMREIYSLGEKKL